MDESTGSPKPIRARTGWVQVWQGDGEGQAAIIAGALEERGMETRVHGTQPLPQAFPTAWARNNWEVYVRGRDASLARLYLHETGEDANIVEGGTSAAREQIFLVKLAVASVLGLVVASAIGLLFFDWSA